ncbi:MAG: peptidase T [Bacteroidales bacterium]|nr:peptidase T [Bacteroidales bacterium]
MPDRLLERFLRYVQMDTQADERSATYPSTPNQLELGRMLRDELFALGLTDAKQTEQGIVTATVPSNVPGAVPTVALVAHVDTSPEFSGKGVRPQVISNYPGGDIVLPQAPERVIRVSENPELQQLIGKTIITTDGTTLLGADDKAGVAVIMQAVQTLIENPSIPHGPVRVCFTCDEEIGKGVLHVDLQELAADVAYTLDGAGAGEVEGETFSADKATITITGVNIHPSIAKGRMVNAVRLAGMFLERLPKRTLTPETTAEREGFLHPYVIEGGVPEVKIHCLLRDFDTPRLVDQAARLRTIAQHLMDEYPEARITVDVQAQYRNMRDGMTKEPRAVPYALEAIRRAGLTPRQAIIRGGTDGSRLTEMGLPTPNLSTGEHNPHSPLEWACLEEMQDNVRIVVELLQVWAGK